MRPAPKGPAEGPCRAEKHFDNVIGCQPETSFQSSGNAQRLQAPLVFKSVDFTWKVVLFVDIQDTTGKDEEQVKPLDSIENIRTSARIVNLMGGVACFETSMRFLCTASVGRPNGSLPRLSAAQARWNFTGKRHEAGPEGAGPRPVPCREAF